jgi:arabinofuranan 3-O-arabinosyltransferase
MILAVGSHPYAAPSSLGGLIKTFMTKTTAGLALRSTNRATPMVVLGLAVLLGAGITALARRRRSVGLVAAGVALVLVGFANPPVWNGTTVLDRYTFPTPVPKYVTTAAKALNAEDTQTRVLAIPGQNDAAYRYSTTIDPIWPGLLTRPFVTRQQLALGSLPSYDMTYAIDVPMQNRTADPAALAPMARLMSVGDILVQNDLNYALYDRPPPRQFWASLHLPQAGLSAPVGYGKPITKASPITMVDEYTLAAPPDEPNPAALEVLGVADPRPIARAESTQGALVVATPWASTTSPASASSTRGRPCSTRAPSTTTPAPSRAR